LLPGLQAGLDIGSPGFEHGLTVSQRLAILAG
jgi:hypothetical protein